MEKDPTPAAEPGEPSEIAQLVTEVRLLRRDLPAQLALRPTRHEATYRRRLNTVWIVLLIVVSMQTVDLHTEVCGTGTRSDAVVTALLKGKIHNEAELQRVVRSSTPGWVCGFTFPTHTHDGHSWPEWQHLAGLGTYIAVLLGLRVWAGMPLRNERSGRASLPKRRWDDNEEDQADG